MYMPFTLVSNGHGQSVHAKIFEASHWHLLYTGPLICDNKWTGIPSILSVHGLAAPESNIHESTYN